MSWWRWLVETLNAPTPMQIICENEIRRNNETDRRTQWNWHYDPLKEIWVIGYDPNFEQLVRDVVEDSAELLKALE